MIVLRHKREYLILLEGISALGLALLGQLGQNVNRIVTGLQSGNENKFYDDFSN